MNIFYLHKDPKTCAEMHCDKHVCKMIIEYAQLMSTAHRVIDGVSYEGRTANNRRIARWLHPLENHEKVLYKASHINHPSNIWVRESQNHYNWLYEMWTHLCDEYTHRYDKIHMTDSKLRGILENPTKQIEVKTIDDPYLTMPNYVKQPKVVEAYKNYYINYKKDFAKWTKRPTPKFMNFETHAGYAS